MGNLTGVHVAERPAAYSIATKNSAADAACADLSMLPRIVCAANANEPVQITVPEGAGACANSGAGVACGVSDALTPDTGVGSTPAGSTPCTAGVSQLPPTPAACTDSIPDSSGQPVVSAVVPSVPAATLNPPTRIQLMADAATEMPGRKAVLTASTDRSVSGTGRAIEIFDMSTGRLAAACLLGSSCSVAYAAHAGRHSFAAFVMPPSPNAPKANSQLASNVVNVSWIAVTMVADRTVVGPGKGITLTATSTVAIDKTGWLLQLYDAPTHTRLTYCASGNTCRTTITQASAGGRALVAVLAPPSATAPPANLVVGQTDVFSVNWLGVAVRATANGSQSGGVIHVEASVNADLKNTGWALGIFDNHGQLVAPTCNTGTTCTANVTIAGAMPSFSAAVGTASAPEGRIGQLLGKPAAGLTNIQAASQLVTPVVHTSKVLWGVDSCRSFTAGMYPEVAGKLGKPDFWGRYLTNTVCPGIGADEIASAHQLGMGILPIYNDYDCSNVVGYDTGRGYGAAAAAAARGLGIPSGVALAIDIEPPGDACPGAGNVDQGFVQGWFDGVFSAGYVPAYYGNGGAGSAFATAYCVAVSYRPQIADDSHLWTYEPSLWGSYSRSNLPDWGLAYNSHCPEHGTAWQFMLSAGSDPDVDQDLVISDFPLWYP